MHRVCRQRRTERGNRCLHQNSRGLLDLIGQPAYPVALRPDVERRQPYGVIDRAAFLALHDNVGNVMAPFPSMRLWMAPFSKVAAELLSHALARPGCGCKAQD